MELGQDTISLAARKYFSEHRASYEPNCTSSARESKTHSTRTFLGSGESQSKRQQRARLNYFVWLALFSDKLASAVFSRCRRRFPAGVSQGRRRRVRMSGLRGCSGKRDKNSIEKREINKFTESTRATGEGKLVSCAGSALSAASSL